MLKQVLKILTNKRISNLKKFSFKSDKKFFIDLAEYAEKYKIEHEPKDILKSLNIENIENKISGHFTNKKKVNMNLHQLKINNKDLMSNEGQMIDKENAIPISLYKGDLESGQPINFDVLYENVMNDYQKFPKESKIVKDCDSVISSTETFISNKIDNFDNGKMQINEDENHNKIKDNENSSDTNDKISTMELLLRYGVNLKQLQSKTDGIEIMKSIDWKTDIEPLILFMKKQTDFNDKQLAEIFSSCPRIFRVSKVEIQQLFDYLINRKLKTSDLVTIFHIKPSLITCNKTEIEKQFEELEESMGLTKSEMNHLIYKYPAILMENIHKLKANIKNLRIGHGFSEVELRKIIIGSPEILLQKIETVNQNFIFLNRTLNISYEDIANSSKALALGRSKLIERVKYLISLNKYPIISNEPSHIYINSIAEGTDLEFIKNIALTSISEFRAFIKTL